MEIISNTCTMIEKSDVLNQLKNSHSMARITMVVKTSERKVAKGLHAKCALVIFIIIVFTFGSNSPGLNIQMACSSLIHPGNDL